MFLFRLQHDADDRMPVPSARHGGKTRFIFGKIADAVERSATITDGIARKVNGAPGKSWRSLVARQLC